MSQELDPAFSLPSLGIIGFGAFGRLMAAHLRRHFRLYACDPACPPGTAAGVPGVTVTDLAGVAACPIVVLAVPVNRIEETVRAIAPRLRPGTLVLDVGSVKMVPAEIMRTGLPEDVEVVATHPLFGPQSARDGIAGLKIAVCPIRGRRAWRVAAFLRKALDLRVFMTTPEAHDAEMAMAQGLTHVIANVLMRMGPLPTRLTTKSFDLMARAVDMVRHDSPEVFQAIESTNPFSRQVRSRFFELASALDAELRKNDPAPRGRPGIEALPMDDEPGETAPMEESFRRRVSHAA